MEENTNQRIKILYVDDEPNNLLGFKSTFRRDYDIFTAESAAEGERILENEHIDIIFTDQRMPGVTGAEFLASIIDRFPDPMRILLTGFTDFGALVEAVNKGHIYRYMQKPWSEDDIRMAVSQAYEVYDLRRKNRDLTEELIRVNDQLEFLLRQQLLN